MRKALLVYYDRVMPRGETAFVSLVTHSSSQLYISVAMMVPFARILLSISLFITTLDIDYPCNIISAKVFQALFWSTTLHNACPMSVATLPAVRLTCQSYILHIIHGICRLVGKIGLGD